MGCQLGREIGNLVIQLDDDSDRGARGGANAAVTAAGAVSCSVRNAA